MLRLVAIFSTQLKESKFTLHPLTLHGVPHENVPTSNYVSIQIEK